MKRDASRLLQTNVNIAFVWRGGCLWLYSWNWIWFELDTCAGSSVFLLLFLFISLLSFVFVFCTILLYYCTWFELDCNIHVCVFCVGPSVKSTSAIVGCRQLFLLFLFNPYLYFYSCFYLYFYFCLYFYFVQLLPIVLFLLNFPLTLSVTSSHALTYIVLLLHTCTLIEVL